MDIFLAEGMRVKFRYFDLAGQQLTQAQLRAMQVVTPAMDHVFATALERIERTGSSADQIEKHTAK